MKIVLIIIRWLVSLLGLLGLILSPNIFMGIIVLAAMLFVNPLTDRFTDKLPKALNKNWIKLVFAFAVYLIAMIWWSATYVPVNNPEMPTPSPIIDATPTEMIGTEESSSTPSPTLEATPTPTPTAIPTSVPTVTPTLTASPTTAPTFSPTIQPTAKVDEKTLGLSFKEFQVRFNNALAILDTTATLKLGDVDTEDVAGTAEINENNVITFLFDSTGKIKSLIYIGAGTGTVESGLEVIQGLAACLVAADDTLKTTDTGDIILKMMDGEKYTNDGLEASITTPQGMGTWMTIEVK